MTFTVLGDAILVLLGGAFFAGCMFIAAYSAFAKDGLGVLASLAIGAWMGQISYSAYRRIKKAKSRLNDYTKHLSELSYNEAVLDAQQHCVSFPHELAMRKFKPTSAEWRAFERQGMQFVIEKPEVGLFATVTILE